MKENLDNFAAKKRRIQEVLDKCNPHSSYYREQEEQMYRDLGDDDVQEIIPPRSKGNGIAIQISQRKKVGAKHLKQQTGIGSYFMPRTGPDNQPTIKSVLQSKEVIEKCDLTISKWVIDACIPFNAVNSVYYQQSIDAIASMGPGYKGPNFHNLRGYLLAKNVEEVQNYVESYRSTWKTTGCTIMADGWTDPSYGNWVLEEEPPNLVDEELETFRHDLGACSIQNDRNDDELHFIDLDLDCDENDGNENDKRSDTNNGNEDFSMTETLSLVQGEEIEEFMSETPAWMRSNSS